MRMDHEGHTSTPTTSQRRSQESTHTFFCVNSTCEHQRRCFRRRGKRESSLAHGLYRLARFPGPETSSTSDFTDMGCGVPRVRSTRATASTGMPAMRELRLRLPAESSHGGSAFSSLATRADLACGFSLASASTSESASASAFRL